MKRTELLKTALSEEKNVNVVIENTTKADTKFLKRTKKSFRRRCRRLTRKIAEEIIIYRSLR